MLRTIVSSAHIIGAVTVVLLAQFVLSQDPSVVSTPYGPIKGTVLNNVGIRAFRGIPYAEPPIKQNRWQPPIPKIGWNSTILDATKYGSCCIQDPNGTDPGLPFSENCLFMNIFTPIKSPPPNGFPVMFWIHGGAFISGCSSQPLFYGDFFANSTDTILVTINYRLGALGFYGNSVTGIQPNLGILDQIEALLFNQKIISSFGGDVNSITLFGESAGAMSIVVHLVSPYSLQYKFFHKAIVESDPVSVQYRTEDESKVYNDLFADLIGCHVSDRNCFINTPVEFILTAQDLVFGIPTSPGQGLQQLLQWQPQLDNHLLPEQPLTLYSEGKFYHVPTIFGTCQNETAYWGYTIFNLLGLSSVSYEDYVGLVALFFQEYTLQVLELYPASSDSTSSMFRLTTDYIFVCSTRYLAEKTAAAGIPVWLYSFIWGSSNDFLNNDVPQCSINGTVCHGAEVSFVFNTEEFYGESHTPAEKQLERQMLKTWTDFAHDRLDSTFWPQFSTSTNSAFMWGIPTSIVTNFDDHNCGLFDKIGYNW